MFAGIRLHSMEHVRLQRTTDYQRLQESDRFPSINPGLLQEKQYDVLNCI